MILSHTEPFKTIQLSIYFSEKINKETISYRFLLSNLLISYSNRYPNKRALTDAFLKLYGAHVQSQVFTFGEYHITKINLTIPNPRSEEHTSELQSRENLVCRLLLEKK